MLFFFYCILLSRLIGTILLLIVWQNKFVLASLFTLNHTEAISTYIKPSLNEPSFQLFPNPATEYIQITNSQQITSIEIYDIMGQVIFSEPVSTNTYRLQLNRTKFIAGMYFIRINGADYQLQQSFILK